MLVAETQMTFLSIPVVRQLLSILTGEEYLHPSIGYLHNFQQP
jgi:hypothetical protein